MAAQSTLKYSAAEQAVIAFLEKYKAKATTRLKNTTQQTRTLVTLAFIASIIGSGVGIRRWLRRRFAEQQQGRRLVRRNSSLKHPDGSRTIYVPYKNSTAKVVIHPTKALTFDAHRRLFLNPPRAAGLDASVPALNTKPGLNIAFLHQFLSLMSIMIPRWDSKEAGLLGGLSIFLIARTYISLVVARLDGEIVRDLVAGHGKQFIYGLLKWCGIGTFASYTNAMIKFLESKVSIAFRTRLTRYIHDLYMHDNLNYYKLANLDGGIRQGADQFITQDLTLFCSAAAGLYSSLGKPFIDLCVFNWQLSRSLGGLASIGIMSNYIFTATLLRKLSPPFGKLKAVEGRMEGDFRSQHARLIANAEEVAFYGGANMEKKFLNREFKQLRDWMEGIHILKIGYNIIEDFILKYTWSAYGYLLSALPVFFPAWGGLGGLSEMASGVGGEGSKERHRMKDFITNKRLMLSLADAGGRMMYSIKDLSELAGYTSRVYTLIATLHRVHAGAYYPKPGQRELYGLSDIQGTIQKGFSGVRLEGVPVVAPGLWPKGGEELAHELDVTLREGDHLLVSGPNGVGKSAVARVLAGLWPIYRGLVSRPQTIGEEGIMFLPQRPYLSIGTLRDQVIYPDTEADMRQKGKRESDLQAVLEMAKLAYLPEREGGWDTRKEWKDVLSGGEKQRMGFARLLYHEPKYAIIDEGTSAVSSDVEGLLYDTCKTQGITLITISTRASLKKYHNYSLTLGLGMEGKDWQFERIGTEQEKMQAEKELAELREKLARVPELRRRKAEIDAELAKVWTEGGGELEAPEYVDVSPGSETVTAA